MSKYEKALEKLLSLNSTLTFQELEFILKKSGYVEKKTGKTYGSRKANLNYQSKHLFRIHKPHPGNEIKRYVKQYIISEFKKME